MTLLTRSSISGGLRVALSFERCAGMSPLLYKGNGHMFPPQKAYHVSVSFAHYFIIDCPIPTPKAEPIRSDRRT